MTQTSQCEAGGFAVRGRALRSARRKRSQCEARGLAVRSARPRTAKTNGFALRARRNALRSGGRRKAPSHCDPAATHCDGALRKNYFALRPAWVGDPPWVGARTLPRNGGARWAFNLFRWCAVTGKRHTLGRGPRRVRPTVAEAVVWPLDDRDKSRPNRGTHRTSVARDPWLPKLRVVSRPTPARRHSRSVSTFRP